MNDHNMLVISSERITKSIILYMNQCKHKLGYDLQYGMEGPHYSIMNNFSHIMGNLFDEIDAYGVDEMFKMIIKRNLIDEADQFVTTECKISESFVYVSITTIPLGGVVEMCQYGNGPYLWK